MVLNDILILYEKDSEMKVNVRKSFISMFGLEAEDLRYCLSIFPYKVEYFDVGMKYVGFHIKPNGYLNSDWRCLIGRLENRINIWCNKWLSRSGILVLVKSVLEATPVDWMILTWIHKEILDKMRKLFFRFI